MNTILEIIRSVSPWLFLALCVFSYFSKRVFSSLRRAVSRPSERRTAHPLWFAYVFVLGFREYVTGGYSPDDGSSATSYDYDAVSNVAVRTR